MQPGAPRELTTAEENELQTHGPPNSSPQPQAGPSVRPIRGSPAVNNDAQGYPSEYEKRGPWGPAYLEPTEPNAMQAYWASSNNARGYGSGDEQQRPRGPAELQPTQQYARQAHTASNYDPQGYQSDYGEPGPLGPVYLNATKPYSQPLPATHRGPAHSRLPEPEPEYPPYQQPVPRDRLQPNAPQQMEGSRSRRLPRVLLMAPPAPSLEPARISRSPPDDRPPRTDNHVVAPLHQAVSEESSQAANLPSIQELAYKTPTIHPARLSAPTPRLVRDVGDRKLTPAAFAEGALGGIVTETEDQYRNWLKDEIKLNATNIPTLLYKRDRWLDKEGRQRADIRLL